ncbi:hypothetical protein FKX85_16390 [Echinicola soli]|uniref:Uncharacterized protein n=1 Tax=Echinicola soli TaxID=2591634 RepID=A0A514CL33_9BACT|nr:hypothetical protein [Echinicola soli]QDH80533.1 hypothetical protein FKX85_16390 [Echinicola soli]
MKTLIHLEKEQLLGLKLASHEVLATQEEINHRERQLMNALILGNLDHLKVKLYLCDDEMNHLMVETTVWAVTDTRVCLKASIHIPKNAILEVVI